MKSIDIVNLTIANVATYAASNNDTNTLKQLGISDKSIKLLKKLSLQSLCLLGEAPAPIITCNVDNKLLELFLDKQITRENEASFINELFLADAPRSLLEKNFGYNHREYTTQRELLGLHKVKHGRPQQPDINKCPSDLRFFLEEKAMAGVDINEDPKMLLEKSDEYRVSIRNILAYFIDLQKELA